jgi:ribonucleoside-diphosphate reductase alpha chain
VFLQRVYKKGVINMNQDLQKVADRFFDGDVNIAKIWYKKYTTTEETPQDVWKRMAKLCSEVEKTDSQKEWENKFYEVMKDWRFVPAGRILFGLTENIKDKTRRKVTLSNCFVVEPPQDSLESIMDVAYKMSKIYSNGGGCGVDLSNIRPQGSLVNNAAIYSDGVIPFMNLYSQITSTIAISGRRGALMITLDCSHPDVENFINAKKDLSKINSANISVKITDKFMNAVLAEEPWETTFKIKDTGEEIKKTFSAKKLFELIIKNNWESAEPGIIFFDRAKNYTPLSHFSKYVPISSNPCSEIFLSGNGACLLGSLNLSKFVKYGFTKRAEFDFVEFEKATQLAVRILDNILELQVKYKLYPFQEQINHAAGSRQIGLGIMGLADMFALLGLKYDSDESLFFANNLFEKFRNISYTASIDLAKEKGKFPDFDKDVYFKSEYVKTLPEEIKKNIEQYGIRNITLNACAPTGSLAILAGCSSGIEPIFSLEYTRKVKLRDDGGEETIKVYHNLYRKFLEKQYDYDVSNWITAHHIDWRFRIKMQGAIQKYIDNSISSTINLPTNTPEITISEIYKMAWKYGLKGVTIYRDSCRENILSAKKSRPYELVGKTYQIHDENDDTFYVTVNNILEGVKYRPFEIFINSKESNEYLNVITRLLSAIFRRTNDAEFVVKQLEKSSKNEAGLLRKLARVIADHMGIKSNPAPSNALIPVATLNTESVGLQTCPQCGKKTLKKEGGCEECTDPICGYGKCSI